MPNFVKIISADPSPFGFELQNLCSRAEIYIPHCKCCGSIL